MNLKVALVLDDSTEFDRRVSRSVGCIVNVSEISITLISFPKRSTDLTRISWQEFDGLIINSDGIESIVNELAKQILVVAVSSYRPSLPIEYTNIVLDNKTVIDKAFMHLSRKKLGNIAYCGLTPTVHPTKFLWAAEREFWAEQFCYRNYLLLHKYKLPHMWLDAQFDSVTRDKLAQWLQSLPKPIGIVAANDVIAYQIVKSCQRVSLGIPNQVCLIGIDDDSVVASLSYLAISTVDINSHQLGELAIYALMGKLGLSHQVVKSTSSEIRLIAKKSSNCNF